jgi:hypothetical protein
LDTDPPRQAVPACIPRLVRANDVAASLVRPVFQEPLAGHGLVNFLVLFPGFVQTNALSPARIGERLTIKDGSE